MLRKLMKYEIKSTGRTFLLMYAAIIALSLINRLLMSESVLDSIALNNNWVGGILLGVLMLMYVVSILGTIFAVLILMILRFYRSLLGDEGYLSFSLPVKPWQHLTSKILVGAMWLVSSIIVTLFSIFIIISHAEILKVIGEAFNFLFKQVWPAVAQFVDYRFYLMLAGCAVLIIIGLLCLFLPFYTSIMIGQLWQKHRVLGAVLAYIGLWFINQIINSVIVSFFIGRAPEIFYGQPDFSNIQNINLMLDRFYIAANSFILPNIIVAVCINVAYFLIANYLMERKLNLE